MLDQPTPRVSNGIIALENELLVRDFIELFNERAVAEMRSFLHPEVSYLAVGSSPVTGIDAVLSVVQEIMDAFEQLRIAIREVALNDGVVMVEHALKLGLPGERAHWVGGFATFVLRDYQIFEWRQVYS